MQKFIKIITEDIKTLKLNTNLTEKEFKHYIQIYLYQTYLNI